jgi:serine kinase of HPr protein (carbohydrate metabolism regulator)
MWSLNDIYTIKNVSVLSTKIKSMLTTTKSQSYIKTKKKDYVNCHGFFLKVNCDGLDIIIVIMMYFKCYHDE